MTSTRTLEDRFQRRVTYLRMSVTDRCDFRCVYCMAEDMTFLPRSEVLTLEELAHIGRTFIGLGVRKIRLTGGEPLVRKGVIQLVDELCATPGLDVLAMTSNGSRLHELAKPLRAAGLSSVNISLDTLDHDLFKELTRTGRLDKVLAGIDAARKAGFDSVKLNAVIMRGRNEHEVPALVKFAMDSGVDISFIEEMPLGVIQEHNRESAFVSSQELRRLLSQHFDLVAAPESSASESISGPSRYWRVEGHDSRIGFISPHSENFCATCNRVRLTVEGRLLLCLGNEHSVDLRAVVRRYPGDSAALEAAILEAMDIKPEKHHFDLADEPQIVRFMNMTGG